MKKGIIIALLMTLCLVLSSCQIISETDYAKAIQKAEQYDVLYGSYVQIRQERDDLKDKNLILTQQRDYYLEKWEADELFITYVTGEYYEALLYIEDVEAVLGYYVTEYYYLGDRPLKERDEF